MADRESLIKAVNIYLKDYKFVIASNREPYINKYKGNKIQFIRTVSGLTIAMDPVIRAAGGVWVAWGSGDADKEVVDENECVKIPPDKPRYTLRRIWLSKKEEEGYYYGYANQALWPLCHIAYEKPIFLKEHWLIYDEINKRFAQAILDMIGDEKAFIWLQDYHLALAAKYIKKVRPDVIIALFWHIPWPNREAFRICPQKKEILEGLLACNLVGFHTRYHSSNFMDTVEHELEAQVDYEEDSILYQKHKTLVNGFPISVDFDGMSEESRSPEVISSIQDLRNQIPCSYEILAVSVDRIDYTKGILERFKSIDIFLEKYPEYKEKFLLYQVGALSRTKIETYKNLEDQVRQAAESINRKYKTKRWCPIVLNFDIIDYTQQLALYRSADLCIVSSLHDGMNLVAKEYVAANIDNKGVLILSQFTGAARELSKGALLINPFDYELSADAIKRAIEIPKEQRRDNMRRLRDTVSKKNIFLWAENFISMLDTLE